MCAILWLSGGVGLCLQSATHIFQHMLKMVLPEGFGYLERVQLTLVRGDHYPSHKKHFSVKEQTVECMSVYIYFLKNLLLMFVCFTKSIIQDLKKNFEIVKLVTGSLISCHRLAASVAGPGGLVGGTLVDGRYTYREVLNLHFLLP